MNDLSILMQRAFLVGKVVGQCSEIPRWDSFHQSEGLGLLRLDESEKSVYFNRQNDQKAVIAFENVRKSRWGRTEHVVRIGKMVDGEMIEMGSASWRTFAEFIHAMSGTGDHDLSGWFRTLPISDEMLYFLQTEHDYKYDIFEPEDEPKGDEEK